MMSRETLERFRIRVRLGESFSAEDVRLLLEEIDELELPNNRSIEDAVDDAVSEIESALSQLRRGLKKAVGRRA